MRDTQSQFSKTNQTGWRAPGAPVLDPALHKEERSNLWLLSCARIVIMEQLLRFKNIYK